MLDNRLISHFYFDNYPAVLFQTPFAYIPMYCNTFASIVSFVHGFGLEKWLLRIKATPHLSSDEPDEQFVYHGYEYEMCTCGIYSH